MKKRKLQIGDDVELTRSMTFTESIKPEYSIGCGYHDRLLSPKMRTDRTMPVKSKGIVIGIRKGQAEVRFDIGIVRWVETCFIDAT